MKGFTDLPRGVEKPNSPPSKPNLTKPLRGQYKDGPEGTKLFNQDLASWKETGQGTPSPGGGKAEVPASSQRSAFQRLLRNQGYQNFDGEDR